MRNAAMNVTETTSDMAALMPFAPPIMTIRARKPVARYNKKDIRTYSPSSTDCVLIMLLFADGMVR